MKKLLPLILSLTLVFLCADTTVFAASNNVKTTKVSTTVTDKTPARNVNDGKRTVDDGYYKLRVMYNYLSFNSNERGELNDKNIQKFKLTYRGDSYYTIQADNGKYVGVDNFSNLKNGNRVILTKDVFEWKLTREKKDDKAVLSMRMYANNNLVMNASQEKNVNGTHVIVWTHKGAAPNNACFRFIPLEQPTDKIIIADFNVYNNTGKSIVDLYISESGDENWGEDLLDKYNYKSFSNDKYIKFNFGFDQKTSYDFYMVYSDGSEIEATGLSFSGATTKGGTIRLKSEEVTIELN